mgnify:CR=1 FL=1
MIVLIILKCFHNFDIEFIKEDIMREYSHITDIIHNYKNMEKEIAKQLNYGIDHGTTLGSNREYIWKSLFERIIPKKFNIDRSVFIMDSFGNISKEVDLAIYDEQYTPYIFRYGTIKFIPIEAVAAVIECKSSKVKEDALSNWVESINKLSTGTNSIVRINGHINYGIDLGKLDEEDKITQTSTTPIKILCHMGTINAIEKFDIIIKAKEESLTIKYNPQFSNLLEWYVYLNHYSDFDDKLLYKDEENNYYTDGDGNKYYIKPTEKGSAAERDKTTGNSKIGVNVGPGETTQASKGSNVEIINSSTEAQNKKNTTAETQTKKVNGPGEATVSSGEAQPRKSNGPGETNQAQTKSGKSPKESTVEPLTTTAKEETVAPAPNVVGPGSTVSQTVEAKP